MSPASLFSDLLSVLLPPRCHVCGHPLPRSRSYICAGCLAELPLASYSDIGHNPMADTLLVLPEGESGTAFLRYGSGNATSRLLHDIKYRGFSRLARMLGREAAGSLGSSGIFDEVDILLPIPLHRSKQRARGYNQARQIALGISDVTEIPVGDNLVALRQHSSQTRLSTAARQANVEGVFGVRRPEELEGRTILIVDDVFTTGATMLSAASAVTASCRATRIRLFALASAFHA